MNTEVPRTVYAVARENSISLISAGLAFYIFNSLIPLLLFVIIGITAFGWMESILVLLESLFGSDANALLSVMDTVIGEGAGRGRAALIAAGILVWSSFTMFQSVNMTFEHIYGARAERSFVSDARDTCLILVTVVLAIFLILVLHTALTAVARIAVATTTSVPLLAVALLGIFTPMFYQFSPPTVTVREVLPGAVLTAVSWTVCAVGFRLYLAISESVELYGIAGGVMLLLTWLYIGSLALFVGVVLNAVLAERVEAADRWKVDG